MRRMIQAIRAARWRPINNNTGVPNPKIVSIRSIVVLPESFDGRDMIVTIHLGYEVTK